MTQVQTKKDELFQKSPWEIVKKMRIYNARTLLFMHNFIYQRKLAALLKVP